MSQIVRDDVFKQSGFEPHWKLGAQPQFDCVGRFKTAGGGSGVWLGGPYVLYVAHGSGGWKKSPADLTPAQTFVFTLVKNGIEYNFRGRRWHAPAGTFSGQTFVRTETSNFEAHAFDAFDFCVLELDTTPTINGVVPAQLAPPSTPLLAQPTVWVGFGERGIASTGSDSRQFGHGGNEKPVRKMAWENRLTDIQNWGFKVTASFDADDLPLEGHQAGGSSGGGVFIQLRGTWYLCGLACNGGNKAGNIDWVATRGSLYGARSRAGRIATFYEELQEGVNRGNWRPFESLSWRLFGTKPFTYKSDSGM